MTKGLETPEGERVTSDLPLQHVLHFALQLNISFCIDYTQLKNKNTI